jgi:dolichol-phosphate mannosyltransferase
MAESPYLSIVSPVYRAEKIVDELVSSIRQEALKITPNFEIILVEDCSPDESWRKIEENCSKYKEVKGIKLSRNFGQHFAITCGIDHADGDYVIVMDCDLQDNPKYFSEFINEARKGSDIVYSYKKERKHNRIKDVFAKLFNMVFNYLIENKSHKSDAMVGAYSLLSRKAVLAFRQYGDYQRHYLMVLRWLGFRHTYISIEHNRRFEGKSSYNFSKLIHHALNGITSQSDKLLRLNATVGIALSLLSFLGILIIIILYFTHGFLSGWASLIVTVLFSTGVLLTSIGIIGIYLGKAFEQTKNRPKYLVDERLNFNQHSS